jgi:hypothetical protein
MRYCLAINGDLFFAVITSEAQCSICACAAQHLGEKLAQSLGVGIIYLAFAPLARCISLEAVAEGNTIKN